MAAATIGRNMRRTNVSNVNLADIASGISDYSVDYSQPRGDVDMDESEFKEILADSEKSYMYDPSIHNESFNNYHRRFEDVSIFFLQKYISDAFYGTCYYEKGAVKTFLKNNRAQHTFTDIEDSSSISESDLLTEENVAEWSQSEIANAMTQLPYVVKRLHALSMLSKVHILSFVSAYVRARRLNIAMQMAGSTKTLKVNAVVDQGVYLCTADGDPTYTPDISAKNVHIAKVFNWYSGMTVSEWEKYRVDIKNLLHYTNVLNIDIESDDMTRYNADYCNSLLVTVLTPEVQYNADIYKELRRPSPVVTEADSISTRLEETMAKFEEYCDIIPALKARINSSLTEQQRDDLFKRSVRVVNNYLIKIGRKPIPLTHYYFENGYLHCGGEICIVSTEHFCRESQYNLCPEAILSDTGFVVGLTSDFNVYGMDIYAACTNIDYHSGASRAGAVTWDVWSGI